MKSYPFKLLMAALALYAGWGCHSVAVIHPGRKELVETVYASGKIVPENEYSLSALCSGRVVRKFVRDGDTVRKGQVLFLVSNDDVLGRADAASKNYVLSEANLSERGPRLTDLSLALQNAIIRLRNDSSTYYRWKQLWEENIGTRNNLDNCYTNYLVAQNERMIAEQKYLAAMNDLRANRNTARSALAAASKDLQDYSIRSDRDGVVYQTFKEWGEAVHGGEVVALLGECRQPVIRLAVDQQDIDRVRTGQEVLVQADATGSRIYQAVVCMIYPVMNELDQTFRVDARFTGVSMPAFIHSSAEANIIIQRKANSLVLPRSALAGNDSVWVRESGGERKVRVRLGISTPDDVEILAGINEQTAVRAVPKSAAP